MIIEDTFWCYSNGFTIQLLEKEMFYFSIEWFLSQHCYIWQTSSIARRHRTMDFPIWYLMVGCLYSCLFPRLLTYDKKMTFLCWIFPILKMLRNDNPIIRCEIYCIAIHTIVAFTLSWTYMINAFMLMPFWGSLHCRIVQPKAVFNRTLKSYWLNRYFLYAEGKLREGFSH